MFLTVLSAMLVAPPAHALEFRLSCRAYNHQPIQLSAVKMAVFNNGSWQNLYFVEGVHGGEPVRVQLTPKGSGTDQYNEYAAASGGQAINISGAGIEKRFQWVNLLDAKGTSFALCRKN